MRYKKLNCPFVFLFVKLFGKKDLLNLTNFGAVYLTQFLTDFSHILDYKSYDQALQTLWYHTTRFFLSLFGHNNDLSLYNVTMYNINSLELGLVEV